MRKTFSYPSFFTVEKIIGHFGGIDPTYDALVSMGVDVTKQAVSKWVERGIVPSDAIVALAVFESRNGRDLFQIMGD